MPKSIHISKYPIGMLNTLESICETEEPAFIAYPSSKAASAARFDFYGLINALKYNEHSIAIPASQLKFCIIGTLDNPKDKRVLKIFFPEREIDADFYNKIAQQHAEQAAAKLGPNPIIARTSPAPVKLVDLMQEQGIEVEKK